MNQAYDRYDSSIMIAYRGGHISIAYINGREVVKFKAPAMASFHLVKSVLSAKRHITKYSKDS